MEITARTPPESITTNAIRADSTGIHNDLLCALKLCQCIRAGLCSSPALYLHTLKSTDKGGPPGDFHPTLYLSHSTLVPNCMQRQQQWQ